jgi:hypothetical protein
MQESHAYLLSITLIVMLFLVKHPGKVLVGDVQPSWQYAMQIQRAEQRQKEFEELVRVEEAREKRTAQGTHIQEPVLIRANRWLYERFMCRFPWRSLEVAKGHLVKHIEKLKAKERELEKQELQPIGNAIIGFTDKKDALNMLNLYYNSSTTVLDHVLTARAVRWLHVGTGVSRQDWCGSALKSCIFV